MGAFAVGIKLRVLIDRSVKRGYNKVRSARGDCCGVKVNVNNELIFERRNIRCR